MWHSILFSLGVYSVFLGVGYLSYNLYSFVFDYNAHKDASTQTDSEPEQVSESESETDWELETDWESESEQDDFVNDITYTEPNHYTRKLRKRKFNLIN
jgi:hypothetical protein